MTDGWLINHRANEGIDASTRFPKIKCSMYFAMINSWDHSVGNIEDPVIEWVVGNQLNGDEDAWGNQEWGFYEALSFKDDFEGDSDTFDEDMTQTNFKSIDMAFEDVSRLALSKVGNVLNLPI